MVLRSVMLVVVHVLCTQFVGTVWLHSNEICFLVISLLQMEHVHMVRVRVRVLVVCCLLFELMFVLLLILRYVSYIFYYMRDMN